MAYPNFNNYPNYNNQFYMQELQGMKDRIDSQMRQMQMQQSQQQQPQQAMQPITQNFQIAPQQNTASELESRFANNIDEVKNTFVMKTGLFITKDFNTLWIKNVNGDVKTFALNEIIEQDPKEIEIQNLKAELERMKGMISNESNTTDVNVEIPKTKSTGIPTTKRNNAK